MSTSLYRDRHGSNLVEFPVVVFTLFLVLFFPFANLGTMTLRYGLLLTACKEGVHAAACASSFATSSPGRPSALDAAQEAVYDSSRRFSGIYIEDVTVRVVVVAKESDQIEAFENKLAEPANTRDNLYFIEQVVTARLEPLIPVGTSFFSVPGLTSAWRTSICLREFAESPQGLNS